MAMPKDKRIVLKWLTGPLAGLKAIQGTASQLLADTGLTELPVRVDEVDFRTHTAPARLLAHREAYILYVEEIVAPGASSSVLDPI